MIDPERLWLATWYNPSKGIAGDELWICVYCSGCGSEHSGNT